MTDTVRVLVDSNVCIGSGTCEALQPAAFRVGDDGIAVVLMDEVDAEAALDAVRSCPSGAISIAGEG
jgi:ferredoxin